VEDPNKPFVFDISLSVLNHLGRQLYRSFATVLGEAVSNAWDANAKNVNIYVDTNSGQLWVKDDGIGMDDADFQNKFLKIGYSKRKGGSSRSDYGRPFVGRKGIGKLALLSCADRISVLSKTKESSWIGGSINNARLDLAITEDLSPQKYPLEKVDQSAFANLMKGLDHGTIIRFEGLKDGVKRSLQFIRKTIALNFRFSLLDREFRIYVDDKQVTQEDLDALVEKTEFLWKVGKSSDPFLDLIEKSFSKNPGEHELKETPTAGWHGFLASVSQPRDLKILTMDERVSVDLFVNGRLRERDILKHIPTARLVESYLYGQIHLDSLDDGVDRFTSSREGIVADDPLYSTFLTELRKMLLKIVEDWDEWRRKHREDGDAENTKVSKKQRAAEGLFNAVVGEFEPQQESVMARKVEGWADALRADAAFNFESYAECFVSENLIRSYISDRKLELSAEAKREAKSYKLREQENKARGNVSIDIRRDSSELSYLSMEDLANLVDKPIDRFKQSSLVRDAYEYKPMRDAMAHTALLTPAAKGRLSTIRENIKARIRALLSSSDK
jgi:hypothetical protein